VKLRRRTRAASCGVFLKNNPPDVGKTHLAIALGIEAVRAGFRVQFANASALIERLAKADREKRFEEVIESFLGFSLSLSMRWAICLLMTLALTASFSLFPGDMREHRLSSPQTSPMVNGETFSKIIRGSG
jgi:hypothetical protein